ncbi:UNVERIFIED_CONTAM: hypothetical protein Sangu_2817300 [Sesamum angustifolium]|uniref:DUF4283 domain-containing protein n=1 Tax=Sesamum angustifolium TaxID=2727405 RepID=A0AAW2IR50_9LAMI
MEPHRRWRPSPQPGRFSSPLTSTNPSESTHTNSAKTTSFRKALNTESADRHSANRLANDSIFSKFFLANSNPPPIGATHDINGRPTVIFSDAETQSLVVNFRLALIGKFSQGIPLFSQLHRVLAKSGIKGAFTVSLINNKHALISLSNESDFTRLWLRRIWYLNGFLMRVFKWSPTFTPEQESSIIPIWVNFPELPAHLFRKDALFAIANNIGTPLQIADSTLNQSNLAKARGDAPKPPPHRRKAEKIYKMKGKAVAQDVYKVLDKMPEKTEAGECSKNTTDHHRYASEAVFNSPKEIVDVENDVCVAENDTFELVNAKNDAVVANELEEVQNLIEFNAEKDVDAETVKLNVELNVVHEKETENMILDGTVNAEIARRDVRKDSVAENECIRGIENLDEPVGGTIDVACGGGLVWDCITTDATKGMEIQLFDHAVKPIVTDRKGKSLKQMKTEEVYRLIQKLRKFGVVCHAIKYAECYSKGDAPKPPPHRRKAEKIYKMKGKAVAQDVYKVLDKMPEKTEAGECSKNTTDHHRDVRKDSVAENECIRGIENLDEPVGGTIDVACGGGLVSDCITTNATKGMEIQLFDHAVKPIVTDRKGKSLKQMKTEEVYRLIQKLRKFGVVCHAVKYAVSDKEENSRALFTGPQFNTEVGEQGSVLRRNRHQLHHVRDIVRKGKTHRQCTGWGA